MTHIKKEEILNSDRFIQAAARYKAMMVRRLDTGEEPTPNNPIGPGSVTCEEFNKYPVYYLYGDGRYAANQSYCEHDYRITSSCPNC